MISIFKNMPLLAGKLASNLVFELVGKAEGFGLLQLHMRRDGWGEDRGGANVDCCRQVAVLIITIDIPQRAVQMAQWGKRLLGKRSWGSAQDPYHWIKPSTVVCAWNSNTREEQEGLWRSLVGQSG